VLAQRRDHRRLGGQNRRLQPVIAIPEALACLGDVDEISQIELEAHSGQLV
jgi:hypothetical protein